MVVLVTGAKGQLGQAIQSVSDKFPEIDFVFCSSSDLEISNKQQCEEIFTQYQPNFCINAAAYTAVDKAESEPEQAHLINVVGAKNLAEVAKNFQQYYCIFLLILFLTEVKQFLTPKKILQIQLEFTDRPNWTEKEPFRKHLTIISL